MAVAVEQRVRRRSRPALLPMRDARVRYIFHAERLLRYFPPVRIRRERILSLLPSSLLFFLSFFIEREPNGLQ